MPMIAIDSMGRLIQSDGARHDGKGFGRNATPVSEGSVVLSSVPDLVARQQAQEVRDLQKAEMKEVKRAMRMNAQLGQEHRDNLKRLEVAREAKAPATLNELLILGESMRTTRRDAFGNAADFSQWNTIPAKGDFGSHADFQTYSTYSDPYQYDPYAGVPTDFDRYVAGKPIAPSQGSIPSGMGSSPWALMPRNPGQTNDDYARKITGMSGFPSLADITGINIDLASQIEEAATDVNIDPNQALTWAQKLGLTPAPSTATVVKPVVRSPISITTPTWLVGTTTLPVVGIVQKKTLVLGLAALIALGIGMRFMAARRA